MTWPALNYGRRAKQSLVPHPSVPNGEAVTVFKKRSGIDWDKLQIIDVILPTLSALETEKSGKPSPAVKMRWIKRDTTIGAWYRALSSAMAHVIVDTAKVLVEQSFTLKKKVWKIELPFPAVRKILWGRPTFPYNDWCMNAHGLAKLVPLRVTTWDL